MYTGTHTFIPPPPLKFASVASVNLVHINYHNLFTYFKELIIKWKKEWARSHTPPSNIAWECYIQRMAIPSISDGQSDRKSVVSFILAKFLSSKSA